MTFFDNLKIDDIQSLQNSSLKFESDWMTTAEVASFLRVSVGQIRNWTSNGRLPYNKLGKLNRYSRKEIESLLLSNKRGVF